MSDDISPVVVKESMAFLDNLKYTINKRIRIPVADFDKICICGMGGSAIGGDVVADMLADSYTVPITIIKSIDIPHWVNSKTFVIICSYSGNTKETLSMYEQAYARGCQIAAITSGGELLKNASKNKNYVARLEKGIQPRNALGLTMGYMLNIIESIGGADCKKDIKKVLPQLYKLRNDIGFKNPDNYAKRIADSIHGTVPVIYSTSGITASAIRWKTQINENSKMLAFNGSIPEFNHNEIVGWSESTTKFNCKPVFLYEEDASPMLKEITNTAIETLKANNVEPVVVVIRGKTIAERSLRAIMFGDFVSLYLAFMNNVDPIEVRSISSFKERIAKHLVNRKKTPLA